LERESFVVVLGAGASTSTSTSTGYGLRRARQGSLFSDGRSGGRSSKAGYVVLERGEEGQGWAQGGSCICLGQKNLEYVF
jgi:hypothetical protein